MWIREYTVDKGVMETTAHYLRRCNSIDCSESFSCTSFILLGGDHRWPWEWQREYLPTGPPHLRTNITRSGQITISLGSWWTAVRLSYWLIFK